MRSVLRLSLTLLLTVALTAAAGCDGGDGAGGRGGAGQGDGSVARAAKQRVDDVVRALIAAVRRGVADPDDAQVRGAGSFTRCGLGATSTQYVGRAAIMAGGAHIDIGSLRAVLSEHGFTVTDREGDLVGHDEAGVVVVVHAPLDAVRRPGSWSLDLVGSSVCAEYPEAENALAARTTAEDYSQ